jgi:hypothetical protein
MNTDINPKNSEEHVQASLAAMRASFDQFAESFLALTKAHLIVLQSCLVLCCVYTYDQSIETRHHRAHLSIPSPHTTFEPNQQGAVQWELVLKPEYDFGSDPHAVMPARPYHREARKYINDQSSVS